MNLKIDIHAVTDAWAKLVASVGELRGIRSKEELQRAAAVLDALLQAVNDDEESPLLSLIELLSEFIETYEAKQLSEPNADPADVLRLLMRSNGLKQTDLAVELGGQSVVSSILSSRREINARQARALGKRFGISPAVFIGPGTKSVVARVARRATPVFVYACQTSDLFSTVEMFADELSGGSSGAHTQTANSAAHQTFSPFYDSFLQARQAVRHYDTLVEKLKRKTESLEPELVTGTARHSEPLMLVAGKAVSNQQVSKLSCAHPSSAAKAFGNEGMVLQVQ